MKTTDLEIATALEIALAQCLISANEPDRNGEAANVVDGLFYIGRALHRIADVLAYEESALNQSLKNRT